MNNQAKTIYRLETVLEEIVMIEEVLMKRIRNGEFDCTKENMIGLELMLEHIEFLMQEVKK